MRTHIFHQDEDSVLLTKRKNPCRKVEWQTKFAARCSEVFEPNRAFDPGRETGLAGTTILHGAVLRLDRTTSMRVYAVRIP